MRYTLLLCGVWLLGLAGCKRADPSDPLRGSGEGHFSHLASADEFVLYSLDPTGGLVTLEQEEMAEDREGFFRGYPVLGRLEDVPVADRKRLLAALQEGVDSATKGLKGGCWEPRHGIRAVFGSSRTDLVICFECGGVHVHSPEGLKGYPTTRSAPRDAFNEFLQGRGVKIQQPDASSGAKSQ